MSTRARPRSAVMSNSSGSTPSRFACQAEIRMIEFGGNVTPRYSTSVVVIRAVNGVIGS